MRSILLLFLVFGASNAFLTPLNQLISGIGDKIQTVHNSITQTANNLWNGVTGQVNNVIGNVVDSAGNVYGQLVSTANGVKFTANFLWDNIFGPAYDLFIDGWLRRIFFFKNEKNRHLIQQVFKSIFFFFRRTTFS